jgi:polyphosphate kinase
VVAIKMTVYRTGTDSVLMEHLLRAASKGKEVTVVVELMARFDEEANHRSPRAWKRSAPTWCTAWSATRPTPRC